MAGDTWWHGSDYLWGTDTLYIGKSITLRGEGITNTILRVRKTRGASPYIIIEGDSISVVIENITLECQENPSMWACGCGPWIRIKGNSSVKIRNVEISNFCETGEVADGVQILDSADVHIDSTNFHDIGNAISLSGTANLSLTNCSISASFSGVSSRGELHMSNCKISGKPIAGRADPVAVNISRGSAEIDQCEFSLCSHGISTAFASVVIKESIIVSNYGTGVHSQPGGSSSIQLVNCDINTNKGGISCWGKDKIQVENCTLSHNEGHGIELGKSVEAVISNCIISGNGDTTTNAGIQLNSSKAMIVGCRIEENSGWGIHAVDGAVAVGWENSLSGHLRDIFGVPDVLVEPRPEETKAIVSVPGDVPTLHKAVYMVDEGGTIEIASGIYTELPVGIHKNVTLRGNGADQTKLSGQGLSVFGSVERVVIEGVGIEAAESWDGIRVGGETKLTLTGCKALGTGNDTGLALEGSSEAHVRSCTFSSWRTGIAVEDAARLILTDSTLSGNEDSGIYVEGEAYIEINQSNISNNGEEGIHCVSGTHLAIDECEINGNGRYYDGCGIFIEAASDVQISRSSIFQNTYGGICAVISSDGLELQMTHNKIFENKYGVGLGIEYSRAEFIIRGFGNSVYNNDQDLSPSLADFPWPVDFLGEPVTRENNAPDVPIRATQLLPDKSEIPVGEEIVESSIVFSAHIRDSDYDKVKLQVELRALEVGFDETKQGFKESGFMPSGSEITCIAQNLIPGEYHWRARAIDEHGMTSGWVEFGNNPSSESDFAVQLLDKQLPNCLIDLREEETKSSIDKVEVGKTFVIYLGDSTDDTRVSAVRFSSDDGQDGKQAGTWTNWYSWDGPSDDWDSRVKAKDWTFTTGGQKEVWAEIKDIAGNVSVCSANILVHPGYAIVVSGQGGWRDKRGLDHCANNAYRTLHNLGFDDSHIFYLNSKRPQDVDGDGTDEVDGSATLATLTDVIRLVAKATSESTTPVLIYLVGHGAQDCFIFDEDDSENGFLWVSQVYETAGLVELLSGFSKSVPCTVMIGSCYSGCFITSSDASPGSISTERRIIITSTHDDEERILWGWVRSSDALWRDLLNGDDLRTAFEKRSLPGDIAHLWLDDNGDKIGHSPHSLEDDGFQAASTTIGVPGSDDLKLQPWLFYWIRSPGELRIYDTKGRVTGLVDHRVREEIPDSLYDEESNAVLLFSPPEAYYCEVVGVDNGEYGLETSYINNGRATSFVITDVPTSLGAVHRYTMDWDKLDQGEEGAVIQIDSDGNGNFEETASAGSEVHGSNLPIPSLFEGRKAGNLLPIMIAVSIVGVVLIAFLVFWRFSKARKLAHKS